MSAHDTPEVGSGETVCTCPDDDCRETCLVCIDLADDAPCVAQTARQPASSDPVQPADAGEGLCEYDLTPDERGTIMSGRVNGSPVGVVAAACHVFAAREAAWAEKYAAVVGERDEWEKAAWDALTPDHNCDHKAALATALREKAEDRARVEAVEAAYANTTWWHTGGTPCIPKHILRAALAIPTTTGDE